MRCDGERNQIMHLLNDDVIYLLLVKYYARKDESSVFLLARGRRLKIRPTLNNYNVSFR